MAFNEMAVDMHDYHVELQAELTSAGLSMSDRKKKDPATCVADLERGERYPT